jgi:hypothetical protein
MATCLRCEQEYPDSALNALPSWLLSISSAFWALGHLPRTPGLQAELQGRYCRPCRRLMCFALFFLGFLVTVFAVTFIVCLF